ncbi:hypothetical protein DH2020_011888 [Rehmannia glutinosa]|uniref:NB-ARC domain-containing protein n=1 Tax=Rehmannia glutinosa TaxID=99300 RepID=A0ABR0XEV9_REHGL
MAHTSVEVSKMAYAAVVSLMLDLDQLLSTDSCVHILEKEKIEFLYKELDFLESFLRNYKYRAGDFTKDLEIRIKNVARKAEDLIDVHLYNGSLQEEPELHIGNSLLLVMDEIMSIKTEIMKFGDETGLETESPYISKRPPLSDQDNLVGVEDDVEKILDRLTGYRSCLDVISVVGMGGIGKTSLVRRIFKHPMVVQRFDFPLWANVSQNYRAKEILASLVLSIAQPRNFSRKKFKFLKVLDLNNVHIFYFDAPIMQLVRLRYLEINVEWCVSIPSSILNLRNLQTLVVRIKFGVPTLPCEIWMMLNLRHLCVDNECYLPDPSLAETDETGLQNLQSLSTISPTCCTKEILSKISNLRKLAIQETTLDTTSGDQFPLDHLANLSCLVELEKFVCVYKLSRNANLARRFLPTHHTFPQRLKELVLVGSYLQWEDMSILGMLPNLEWLELGKHAFWGLEWEQNEDGFPKLKFLLIDETNLEKWVANCITPFQVLEHLVLRNCKSLNEIPCEVGEIATLQVIELRFCSKSAANSAKEIQDEQESMGNDELRLER